VLQLPKHTSVHLGLRSVPQRQPHFLIFEASKRHLPFECRGRVSGRGQWHGRGLLAVVATSGAPRSANEEHSYLLRQRQRRLPIHQPHPAPAHETCRDRPPFYAGSAWPSVISASCTFRRHPSLWTSSRRVCLLLCS
jgi:hypothetical protein